MPVTRVMSAVIYALLALALLAPGANALVMRMDDATLTRASERVVVATVEEVSSAWNPQRTEIGTTVRVTVEETLAGPPGPAQLIVRVPGGRVGDLACVVSDIPTFTPGERCVLFLGPGHSPVVGGEQGKKGLVGNRIRGEQRSLDQLRELVRGVAAAPGAAAPQGAVGWTEEPATRVAPEHATMQRPAAMDSAATGGDIVPGEFAATETLLNDTFEGAFPGSWARYGSPTWGLTDYRSVSATHSVFCAGSSITPPVNYANNMNSWMVYGPFDLSTATAASLTFSLWLDAASGDSFFYGSSPDDYDYSGDQQTGNNGGWVTTTLDLAANLGDADVWVALVFASNSTGTAAGAFVDNVLLTREVPSPNAPTITNITPTTRAAGMGEQITITGTRFKATRGTGKVEFLQASGQPKIEASAYSSWSDTQIVCTVPPRASSGPVTVTTVDGTGPGYNIEILYGWSGQKYFSPPVTLGFRVNANTSDCTGEETAVSTASTTWNNANAADALGFNYLGTTTDGYGYDTKNTMLWATGLTAGTIAVNTTWYNGSTNECLESDIRFNDDYAWSTSGTTPGGSYDVQTIALHEQGHCFILTDLYGGADTAKTMYGYGGTGEQRRSLSTYDKAGMWAIYPTPTLVRVAGLTATARPEGTLLEFGYTDPGLLVEFRVERVGVDGTVTPLASIPQEPGRTTYRYLDRGHRATDASEYRLLAVSLTGQIETLWQALPVPR